MSKPFDIRRWLIWPLLGDTVTARMLRVLYLAGSMTQVDFMREYHRRCARQVPSLSGFRNNFGRFIYRTGVITQESIPGAGHRQRLRWSGPSIEEVIGVMSEAQRYKAMTRAEWRISNPRPTDTANENAEWTLALQGRPISALLGRKVSPMEPLCAREMRCLCAGHARGLSQYEPCNTDEDDTMEAHAGHRGVCGLALCTAQHEREQALARAQEAIPKRGRRTSAYGAWSPPVFAYPNAGKGA